MICPPCAGCDDWRRFHFAHCCMGLRCRQCESAGSSWLEATLQLEWRPSATETEPEVGLALLELMPVDVAPYTHAPALSKGSNTCLPVRMTVWVYDVGTWVDIAAKWALSCKECRDDSSRACEAGDVGRVPY